ncbi:MAG: ATP-dependent zinc metalloprotease FtsH [Puniceicoccales bacterium]|jgi:cell division protease FtsH|nr:ATP-dependent zinc metalloprotease FtsH [Puniceicoccales bacterium]
MHYRAHFAMVAPIPNKNHNRFRSLIIWMIIIVVMCFLWDNYNENASLKEHWTISQVLDASKKGKILQGFIKSDPSKGEKWHILSGKAATETPILLLNGQVRHYILFEAEGKLTNKRFEDIIASSEVWREVSNNNLLTSVLLSILPLLIIIFFIYIFFFRQIKNANRTALSFWKSKARLVSKENNTKTFEDFAGYEEAKEEVAEIVDFLKNPQKFRDIGAKIPKGCLMVGPPGTGKTLLARAIAGEANVPFFNMSGSDFVEMFVGLGAARVRDTFEQARKNAPCLVFIDEIDAVGRNRGAGIGGGNDEREQTLNSLLVEMDGFDENNGVIVIAATNRPDVLDNALLRPGRFDRQVVIDAPDLIGRLAILKVHAKRFKLKPNVSLKEIARHTSGFSGADLENLLNEAAILCARYDHNEIDRLEIDEAYDKVAYGRERRKFMDRKDKRITAFHEAGHAIVQAIVDSGDIPVHKVTILPRGKSLGSTMAIPRKDILNYSKTNILNNICCAMGGRVAEEIEFQELTSGAAGDIKAATKWARHMVCDWGMSTLGTIAYGENQDHIFLGKEIARNQNYSEQTAKKIDDEIAKVIQNEYERAQQILKTNYALLVKLAEALLKYETIEGKSVYELVQHGDFKSKLVSTYRRTLSKKTKVSEENVSKETAATTATPLNKEESSEKKLEKTIKNQDNSSEPKL